MIKTCGDLQINLLLLSETNTRWNSYNQEVLERQFSQKLYKPKLIASSTNVNLNKKSDFLPGEIISIIWGRV